jgi:dihydrodipicolinate synthase/N-acetylneuraminate lyase
MRVEVNPSSATFRKAANSPDVLRGVKELQGRHRRGVRLPHVKPTPEARRAEVVDDRRQASRSLRMTLPGIVLKERG